MVVAKRQGRSKEGPRTRMKTSGRTNSTPLHRAGPGGGKQHIKGGAKHFLKDSLSRVHALFSLSLSLSLSLFLSCYLLNKIEL